MGFDPLERGAMKRTARELDEIVRLDYRGIKEHADEWKRTLEARRMPATIVDDILGTRGQWVKKKEEWDELRRQRTHIGKSKLLSIDEKKEQAVAVKAAIAEKKKELDTAATDLRNRALYFPNALHPDVVIGEEGKVAACNHDPEDIAKAASKADHLDIGKRMRLLDFETPAEVTGSNFVTLANELALLEHALVQFAFVRLYREGFTLLNPSDLVKRNVLEACGFNPKGESTQIYSIENSDLCLVGTGEIPLAGNSN